VSENNKFSTPHPGVPVPEGGFQTIYGFIDPNDRPSHVTSGGVRVPPGWILDRLDWFFEYKPDGRLLWKQMTGTDKQRLATKQDTWGYNRVHLEGYSLAASHIIWALHNKEWPERRLRRINRVNRDDRIENLREGPTAHKVPAYVNDNGRRIYLGVFESRAEAEAAKAAYFTGEDLV
jgi:hypothetical protein